MIWSPMISTKYYAWLKTYVSHKELVNHHQLLEEIWLINYTYHIPNDENRAEDGRALRAQFKNDTGHDVQDFGACTMLEMLIALASRMNDSFYDWDIPDQTSVYFWEMLNNLQLLTYTDEYIMRFPIDSAESIAYTFKVLNDRTYKVNGHDGGLFPLSVTLSDKSVTLWDQTKTEIWYQMMRYMSEKG